MPSAAFGPGWEVRGQGPLALDEESEPEPDVAGLADYWIVNLVTLVVEVCREPSHDPAAAFGWCYRSVVVFGRVASVSSLALPSARIRVSDLLS